MHGSSFNSSIKEDSDTVLDVFFQRFDESDAGFTVVSIKKTFCESISSYYTRFLEVTNDHAMPEAWLVATFVNGFMMPVRKIVKPQELSS